MGVANPRYQELLRLEAKTLDAQFLATIRQGLNCSEFESLAVLEVVKEVYFPFLAKAQSGVQLPGKCVIVGVCADEPAGKPIAQCQKLTICLSLHRGAEDDQMLQRQGAARFRQSRIPELCQEALSQGVLLTREDLAYRVFFVSTRTISRDLAVIRKQHPAVPLPLRSTVQDMGPVLTHRVEIVRLALAGKTMSEICHTTRHSAAAVSNYLSTFTRVAQLAEGGMHTTQMAFLLSKGRTLIDRYLKLLKECEADPNFKYHLEELKGLGRTPPTEKKAKGGHR